MPAAGSSAGRRVANVEASAMSEASAALRVLAKGMGEAAQRGLLAAALRAVATSGNEVIRRWK